MTGLGSLGITELMIICCGCLIPIIVAAGVVIAFLVVGGRRKPKATRQAPPPAPRAEPAPPVEAEPVTEPKAVRLSELTTKSCSACGADNPAGNAFCEYCGASLAQD